MQSKHDANQHTVAQTLRKINQNVVNISKDIANLQPNQQNRRKLAKEKEKAI